MPIEPALVIDVPGCTCNERRQEQLDCGDVCDACVSYFDLGPLPKPAQGHTVCHDRACVVAVGDTCPGCDADVVLDYSVLRGTD